MEEIAKAHIYNVVTPTGIAQAGAIAALSSPSHHLQVCVAEWQRRRDRVLEQLKELPAKKPSGGWSMLLDVGVMGLDSFTASRLLMEKGRIAATPMRDWGESNGDCFIRLVFSNEPVNRLASLGLRVSDALHVRG
jgi:aspartate/methionine/tyrosine aminotransferase